MMILTNSKSDQEWLQEAIELSRNCPVSVGAFAVGAIIVSLEGTEVARGYSRETNSHVHAEECALMKAAEANINLAGCTIYSSLEPCSVRLSGRRPCTDRIIESGIARVVLAMREPVVFVTCDGVAELNRHGITVTEISELAYLVAEINVAVLNPLPQNPAPEI